MKMKLKIKKNATVEVVTGADKGKRGKVLVIQNKNKKLRIKVSGVKMMTNFDKQNGITKAEGFIDYSNVKLIENAAPAKKEAKKKTAKAAKA